MENQRALLVAAREMARARVKALQDGGEFYSPGEKMRYLKMYEERVRELERLLEGPAGGGGDDSLCSEPEK